MIKLLSIIFLLIVAILGASFGLLNAQTVSLRYFLGRTELPLSLLLFISLGIGCFLGLMVGCFTRYSLRLQLRQAQSKLKQKNYSKEQTALDTVKDK